jgi:peptidoglycan hydrolase CwlO-like protein
LVALLGSLLVLSPHAGGADILHPFAVAGAQTATVVDRSVAAAQQQLDESHARRALAQSHIADLEAQASAVQSQLAQLGDQRRDLLNQLAKAEQQARRLAVDAYVRGAGTDDLAAILDTQQATDAAWRKHMTVGRVDQAREAAFKLRDLRLEVETQLTHLADQASTTDRAVSDAREEMRQAAAAESQAQQQLIDAQEEVRQAAIAEARARQQLFDAQQAERRAAEARAAQRDQVAQSQSQSPAARVITQGDPWEYLRQCESGGNYQAVSPDGRHRGAYQFDVSTWQGLGGRGDPAAASPAEQDARALQLYQLRGRGPWPACGRYLP